MADFDPDAYLADASPPAAAPSGGFDPDAYLASAAPARTNPMGGGPLPPQSASDKRIAAGLQANTGGDSYLERQIYSNMVKGVAGLPGVPGYLIDAGARAGHWAGKKLRPYVTGQAMSPEEEKALNEDFEQNRPANYLPTPETFIKPVEQYVTGPLPEEDPDKPIQNIAAAGLGAGMFGPLGAASAVAGKTAETLVPDEYKEAAGLVAGAFGPKGMRSAGDIAKNAADRIAWATDQVRTPAPKTPAPTGLQRMFGTPPPAAAPTAPQPAPPAPSAPTAAPQTPAPTATPRPGLNDNVRLLPPDVDSAPVTPALRDSVGAARAETILDQMSPETIEHWLGNYREHGRTPDIAEASHETLSPHETFAEINEDFAARAGGIYAVPGQARTEIGQTFRGRHQEQPERLNGIFNQAFGPEVNKTQWENIQRQAAKEESAPFWQAFDRMVIAPTPEIEAVLQRPAAQRFLRKANDTLLNRGMEIENGFPVLGEEEGGTLSNTARREAEEGLQEKRVPTARAFQLLKEEIDGANGTAVRAGNRQEVRTLTQLKHDIDAAVAAHPNQQIAQTWRQARNLYRGPMQLIDARKLGEELIRGKHDATEVPGLLEGMNEGQRGAVIIGMRNAMSKMANAVTPSGLKQIRTPLGGDNQQIIRAAIGDERAERLFHAVEAEHRMHYTPTNILGNQATGASAAQRAAYRDVYAPKEAGSDAIETAIGLVHKPGRTIGRKMLDATIKRGQAAREAAALRLRDESTRLLTLQGPERDAIDMALARRAFEGEGGLGAPTAVNPMGRQPLERTAIRRAQFTPPDRKVGLSTIDDYLNANGIPFRKETSKSLGSLSAYYFVKTPDGMKKMRVSDHIGNVGEHANFPLGSDANKAFAKIGDTIGRPHTERMARRADQASAAGIRKMIAETEAAKAEKKYDTYGPYDYDSVIGRHRAKLKEVEGRLAAPSGGRPIETKPLRMGAENKVLEAGAARVNPMGRAKAMGLDSNGGRVERASGGRVLPHYIDANPTEAQKQAGRTNPMGRGRRTGVSRARSSVHP